MFDHGLQNSWQVSDYRGVSASLLDTTVIHISSKFPHIQPAMRLDATSDPGICSSTQTSPSVPEAWLLGTEFVEHFFGLARTSLPDFTHAELVKTVQNVMVRQCFLLMDHFREKRRGDESAAGYIMEHDPSPLIPDDAQFARVNLTPQNITSLVELIAFREASQICRQILKIRVPNSDVKHVKLAPLGTVEMAHKNMATVREAEALNGELDDNDCDTTSSSSASDDDNFMVTPELGPVR
ncbi:hypothetical protein BKA82DRAFT_9650 [Pisolithus tinctorius]|uniref:Uncharacterized protein n=1 Tax=Pisolithus tinctorius Marx 270 TaxID=870435 RepID=A0A0C3J1D6_PISTI|nr:hypothetical protein BKA82DRAFT_9650 [Pisolithus tinctorius]KIO02858.1 hypothetical protein M404DRAFT_9650 [Pisolithus tinctorius Marx 270]